MKPSERFYRLVKEQEHYLCSGENTKELKCANN